MQPIHAAIERCRAEQRKCLRTPVSAYYGGELVKRLAISDWLMEEILIMTTLDEYFNQTDTPSRNSPVGRLIQRIVEDDPTVNFETARAQANECLLSSSGKKVYRVFTPKQTETNKANTRNYFKER